MMKRVMVVGRGGAGKSTFARELASLRRLPRVELDRIFWKPGPQPTPRDEWTRRHHELITRDTWVIDGDLGDHDIGLLPSRVERADTIVIFDFPLWTCAWRSLRRSRETWEFWRWLITYRRKRLKPIVQLAEDAHATVHVFRNSDDAAAFLGSLTY